MLSIDADYTGLELVSFLILCSGLLCVGVTCVPGAHEKSLGTGTSRGKIRVCGVHSTLRVAGGIGSRQGSWYGCSVRGGRLNEKSVKIIPSRFQMRDGPEILPKDVVVDLRALRL